MSVSYTEADFDRLSWHDCHIWGLDLRAGDAEEQDWTSDLAFDIDYIVEWICGSGPGGQFRVAPATLVFHGVTEPKIAIDWGRAGFQTSLYPLSIGSIDCERIRDQKVYLDRPYFDWRIRLNSPEGGEIGFGAVGFTQTLRAEPILTVDRQCLTRKQRDRLPRF